MYCDGTSYDKKEKKNTKLIRIKIINLNRTNTKRSGQQKKEGVQMYLTLAKQVGGA